MWVTDLSDKRQFEVVPKKAAKERDFYTVERQDGGDTQVIEKWLGEHVDAHGARVLKDLDATASPPVGADFDWLMLFVAGMALRGRFFRERLDQFTDQLMKSMLWYVGHNDAAFQTFLKSLPKERREAKDFSEEELRDFIRSGKYNVGFEQTYYIQRMMALLPKLTGVLSKRTWHVMRSISPDTHFVCSDHPVSLVPKTPLPLPMGPGYGMPETLVFFPVSRRVALVGTFEGETHPKDLDRNQVAWITGYTAYHAVRYVYSATKEIAWLDGALNVRGTEELLMLNRTPLTEPPPEL